MLLKRENCVKDGRKKKACREIEWSHYEILPDIQSDVKKKKDLFLGMRRKRAVLGSWGKRKKKKK